MITVAEKVQAMSLFLTLIFCLLTLFFQFWVTWKTWREHRLLKDSREIKDLALEIATLGVMAHLKGQSQHRYEFTLKLQKFERLTKTAGQTNHLGIVKK